MAEVIVSPLLQVVFEKLANTLLQEIADRLGLKKEVRKLQRTLYVIREVLADAEEQQLTNRALRIWLTDLKEVAYEMEDLLDELSLESIQYRNPGTFAQQVRSFIPSLVQAAGCIELLPRLKQIKETLEMLGGEMSSFNLKGDNSYRSTRKRGLRQTGSFVVESEVFGREKDKLQLHELLLGKRYLLVLDDVWNEDDSEWEKLKMSLRSGAEGSRTIVTTRSKKVALIMESAYTHPLEAGLIQSPEGRRSLEYLGNEYFEDLVWIFFFQNVQKSGSGYITDCKMHDLIHDLAQSIVGNEFKRLEHDNMTENLSEVRHSTVVCNFSLYTVPEALYAAKKLRSLILLLPKGDLGEVPSEIFSSFRHLRVLDLSCSGIKRLHDSISSTIFLRYLDISSTHVENLPESICNLLNLQVLNLCGCYNLTSLPIGITKLYKLRHLMLNGCERLITMPPWIGKLEYLRTLHTFIVGRCEGHRLKELENLNLGGELNSRQLQNVRDATEAMEANLLGKRNLLSLNLCWQSDFNGQNDSISNDEWLEVLNHLQPHQYLEKLSIRGYQGIHLPRWMTVHKLPNIIELRLVSFRRCKYLPLLGQLPCLKVLFLQGIDEVKNFGAEFYGEGSGRPFPSLEVLTLIDFPSLEFWWGFNRKEEFPSLIKLTVRKCSKLQNMPWMPSLKHLELQSCNEMVLRSASNLTSLSTLVIDDFLEHLIFLDKLLQNNPLLMSLKISSCRKLHCLPPSLGKLTNLKSLAICWCEELHSLPRGLQNLISLESLEIIECPSLVSLSEDIQGLRSLRSLSIENCSNLKSLPVELQFLTALEHLTIMYCPNLASLPDSFRCMTNLKSFSILNCPELKCLPNGLRYVSSMQNLEIRSCPGLLALPEWIAELPSLRSLALSECHNLSSLPSGLQSLSSLQHLSILECPTLEKRCKRESPKAAYLIKIADWEVVTNAVEPTQTSSAIDDVPKDLFREKKMCLSINL
ncbi:hypothetical protein V6N12_065491 [Hibiscus sabdariffa]|uniref:Uncharacterized protein n=1 Tax=Hibiscus sabdariffa TaxID=183260 RepID=A0ABR2G9N3_9ROSI